MQTDVYLQKALIEEVKDELKNYSSINNNGEYFHFNVYPQNLPAKRGKNDDSHFPYVLVCLDEEEIDEEEGVFLVSVYFVIGIIDRNPNNQGHFDVAEVLNRLTKRFLTKRLIASRYRLNLPLTKMFQREDIWPKNIGGLSTIWTVEAPILEETEYD